MADIAIIIPTYNGAAQLGELLPLLTQAVSAQSIFIVDSESTDDTLALAKQWGVATHTVPRAQFNHGGTRKWARTLTSAKLLVYMTQDALPVHVGFLQPLLNAFADPEVGIAYARQLPRPQASPLEAFPRLFNYPPVSQTKSKADLPRLGMKTFFCSNSCCAYRASAWDAVGGFPDRTLTWEDQHLAARMILSGYKIAYVAESQVFHSHAYTLPQEFQRYFDTGAFLKKEGWMQAASGGAEGEGGRLLQEQLRYLRSTGNTHLIPYSLVATGVKFLGYRVGRLEKWLPLSAKKRFSQQAYFWQ